MRFWWCKCCQFSSREACDRAFNVLESRVGLLQSLALLHTREIRLSIMRLQWRRTVETMARR